MGAANRRNFLKAAAISAFATTQGSGGAQAHAVRSGKEQRVEILRTPDHIAARFGTRELVGMQYAQRAWTCAGARVAAEPVASGNRIEIPVRIASEGNRLTHLHLRWNGRGKDSLLSIGDAWERSYGDLEWRGTIAERVMPWYFLTYDGARVDGFGVKTQPSAFCFWQRDDRGITLTVDIRNGGEPTELGTRELHACTVVSRSGAAGETIVHAGAEFCRMMCSAPRVPATPIFGVNDWNYAYGKNTSEGILRDADLVASLAPTGDIRPLVVIDDGWQDRARFPSMPGLAAEITSRHLRPGLWIRPLRADGAAPSSWLLPDNRFGRNAPHTNLAFDPTHPEACETAMKSVRDAVAWGFGFIKHDFTTYELLGRWGFAMGAEITAGGWHFHDRTRTTAEIICNFYRDLRAAAGEGATILGCNTMSHLAAGVFDSQRIADDTSGRDWERTRRYGVNGLAHRIAQHRTFYHVDPDCVAITPLVGWRESSQWMDVVARSGTSLFLSPDPAAVTPEIKSAMRDALWLAVQSGAAYPAHPTTSTTPGDWSLLLKGTSSRKTYEWIGQDGVVPFDV